MVAETRARAVGKAMDPVLVTYRHPINDNNGVVHRAPDVSEVRHTSLSPTTSGCSESGSEMDNHDSGRVSELEGSPKIPLRNEMAFHPDAEIASSPAFFAKGKATIESNLGRTSFSDGDTVTLRARDFKTLVVCVHDARTRLNRMECKVDVLVKALQLQRDESKDVTHKLTSTLLALKNDLKTHETTWVEQNNRCFRPKVHDVPHTVPLSCNNNNLSSSVADSRRIQSSPHAGSQKLVPGPGHEATTFPNFLRTDQFSSPRSVAPSAGAEFESCVNDSVVSNDERPKSEYVNGDVIASSIQPNSSVSASMTFPRSPVYAVVKKKNSGEMIVSDETPKPRGISQGHLSSMNNLQEGPSVKDLYEIIRESADPLDSVEKSPLSASLTHVSRFSDVEGLMAVFEDSFSDNVPTFEEDEIDFESPAAERYDNESLRENDEDNKQKKHEKLAGKDVSIDRAMGEESRGSERRSTYSLTQGCGENAGIAQSVKTSVAQDSSSIAQSVSSLGSGNSDRKATKKGNAFVSNYNKLFKRKGKKKRTESDTSFTFVTSPFYEAEIARTKGSKPRKYIATGQSVESVISAGKEPTVSSLSNVCSSQGGSEVSSSASRGDLNSSIGADKASSNRSLVSVRSPRLKGGEDRSNNCKPAYDFCEGVDDNGLDEGYDNFGVDEQRLEKELRSDVATNEKKPNVPNGGIFHRDLRIPLSSYPPKFEDEQSTAQKDAISREGGIFEEDVFALSGVIVGELQREQADRIRFENDRPAALDKPPPKPSRHGSQHANGGIPGYPRGTPAVPSKQKIMTPEELIIHEAQEKLRIKQMKEAMLQQTLDQQQKKLQEDEVWLAEEERMLNPDGSAKGDDHTLRRNRGSSNAIPDMRGHMEAPPPPSVAPSKPPRKTSYPMDEPAGPPQAKLEQVTTAPTMQLNRDDDDVYKDTMEVVKAVLGMNNKTMDAKADELFASVKTVGAALKHLCSSLEKALPGLPVDFHREIDMAQRTTNKDLSQVINQLKSVQRFHATTQVVDYKKNLMAANQVLAIDAKNLLDVVDRARIRKMQTAQEEAKAQANDIGLGASPPPSAAEYEPEDTYPTGEFL